MMRLSTGILIMSLSVGLTQFASARSLAGPADRQTPSGFIQLSQAADHARDAGQNDDAIRLYRQALAQRPGWKDGLWSLGTLLYNNNQFSEAREILRRFVAYDPNLGLGWAQLGMAEFEVHDYARALDHLERAMALGMGDQKDIANSVFYYVAVLQTRFERFEDSMSLLIAIVKSGQNTDPLIEPLGLVALRLPLLPSEIPADRRSLIHQAGEATLALEAQRNDEAERIFSELVKTYPNEPGVHFLYGAFLMDVRPADAVQEMKRELEVSPFSVPTRLRIAEEYIKEEQVDQALPLAQEAVKLDPTHGATHMMLGEALVAKGDLTGGITELETARGLEPETVRIRWDLLRAYTAAGRKNDAMREKEEIEKLSHPSAGQ